MSSGTPLLLALLLLLLAAGSLTSFKGARSALKLEVDAPLSPPVTVAQPPSPAVPALRSSPCCGELRVCIKAVRGSV
jgi:hypothetical protein